MATRAAWPVLSSFIGCCVPRLTRKTTSWNSFFPPPDMAQQLGSPLSRVMSARLNSHNSSLVGDLLCFTIGRYLTQNLTVLAHGALLSQAPTEAISPDRGEESDDTYDDYSQGESAAPDDLYYRGCVLFRAWPCESSPRTLPLSPPPLFSPPPPLPPRIAAWSDKRTRICRSKC
mgnify:CR=1 FL=1